MAIIVRTAFAFIAMSFARCCVAGEAISGGIAEGASALRDLQQEVESLRVTYALAMHTATQNLRLTEHDAAVYVNEAAFTPHRMFKRSQTIADELRTVDSRGPAVYLIGNEFIKWWQHSRSIARLRATKDDPRYFFESESYLQSLGFWPATAGEPSKTQRQFYFPYALEEKAFKVVSKNAIVDGRSCWKVVGDGGDEAWLDPNEHFLPRKRLWRIWPESNDGGSALLMKLNDWRTAVDGLSLPWVVEITRFESQTGDPAAQNPWTISQLLVRNVSVNALADEDLSVAYEPGTLLIEQPSGATTSFPGGEELLERVVVELAQDVDRHRTIRGQSAVDRARGTPVSIVVASIAAAAVLTKVTWGAFGRRQRTR